MIHDFRIDYRDLTRRFGKNRVLEGISLTLKSGDCIVVSGENGAGKTTLLRILAGLEKPDRGTVSFERAEARPWRRQRRQLLQSLMYLHQHPYMLAGSLRRNLEYAAGFNPRLIDRGAAVDRAVEWAGLGRLEAQSAVSLSGGQQQRVALARARLRNPRALLLDEPTANLDNDSRARTLEMLREFRDSGTAIVVVSHDPENFSALATEHLSLQHHRLYRGGAQTGSVVDLDQARQSHQR